MLLYINHELKVLKFAFSLPSIIEDLCLQRFFHRLAVYITTSNVDHIEATIDPTALATVGFVNLAINTHNTDANAHANLALLINDALAPTADNNTLVNLLSNLANMLTKVTGQSDWKTGPAASIAAILSNLQGNLAVNWDGNKFTVPALGVSGLMAQNGYVNFGKLVGGLIVQWGTGSCNTVRTLPLALSTFKVAFAMHQGTVTNTVIISSQDYASSLTQVKFLTNNSNDTAFVMYIVIGR